MHMVRPAAEADDETTSERTKGFRLLRSFLAPASASSVSLRVLWQEVAYTPKTSLESNHISKTWEK